MNNDIYAEWLVKRKKPGYAPLVYVGAVLLILIGLIASMMNPFGFLVLLLAIGGVYFANIRMNVEYQYVFVNNELSIDRICAQKTRKRIHNLEMQKVEKVVSTKSHEYDFARNNPKLKVVDLSSGNKDADTYAIVYSGSEGQAVYIIEPNNAILKCMKSSAPRKVIVEKALTTNK